MRARLCSSTRARKCARSFAYVSSVIRLSRVIFISRPYAIRRRVSGCSLRPRIAPFSSMPWAILRPAMGQSELTKSGSPSAMRANTGLPIFIDIAKNSAFTP